MDVGIIGLGVIGMALKKGFELIGHSVYIHDKKLDTNLENVINCEIIFICVPTPSKDNGECDTSIVESIIYELKKLNFVNIIAIKSTVPPLTTQNLIKNTNLKICFVPEFLRERCAEEDFINNHELLAVGTDNDEIYEKLILCHGNLPKHYCKLNPTESEILKYYSNSFNAMKITFANEMYEICSYLGVDYSKIKNSFIKRKTSVDMYLDVNDEMRGFAGMCLPKDLSALDYFIKSNNLNLNLFDCINNENKKFKKTIYKGMRFD